MVAWDYKTASRHLKTDNNNEDVHIRGDIERGSSFL